MDLFNVHTATVEPYVGATPTGDGYGTAQSVSGFLDDGLVLTGAAGGEVLVAKTIFYTSLGNVALFTPESRVTCNGRHMQVTSVRRRDGGSLFGNVEHLEVDLG